jgi:hypothetical protein
MKQKTPQKTKCNHLATVPTTRHFEDGSDEGFTAQGFTCTCGAAFAAQKQIPPKVFPTTGPAPDSLCVKCQRPALYFVVRDGTLLCEECAPIVKTSLDDWKHKEVRPLP